MLESYKRVFCSVGVSRSGGRGPVNPKGLLFYKNLIQELKRHGKFSVIIWLDYVMCFGKNMSSEFCLA